MTSARGQLKRGRYHHGNLPAALVAAAAALVEEKGVAALTLRAVAQRVGVTHAAPYRHFKDKAALSAALAEDAYARLTRAVEEARADGPAAAAAAYVRFALAYPASYELVFAATPGALDPGAIFATDDAAALWALCHGVAALANGGRIDRDAAPALAESAARRLMAGS
jgi:AcrR family transcriptional regulator